MKQHHKQAPEAGKSEPTIRKPCVMCMISCVPYGRTAQGNHICSMNCNHGWYKLTLEEQQRRDHAASSKSG